MRTFKKIVLAGICLMLLLCCVPAALAAGHTANCPHCDEVVTWTAWDGTSNITQAGHYYLPEGVAAMTAYRKIGANDADRFDVVLDLNGQELTISKASKMFQVLNGDTLVLFDSSSAQTGGITGKGVSTSHAGIIQAYGGSVEIYSGTYRLADGYQATKDGGLIFGSYNNGHYPAITIHGGNFYGASEATNGSIITGNNAIVTIDGGTFHAGKASSAGDTIYMKNEWAELHISGDPVIEGGVQIGSDSAAIEVVTIQGKPVIMKAPDGSAYGFKLPEGQTIKVGTLEEGAQIGMTGSGVITGSLEDPITAAAVAKNFFVADETDKTVKASGTELVLTSNSAETTFTCSCCGDTATWAVWDGTTALTAGHFYLKQDTQMIASGSFDSSEAATMVLNLNGYTLSKPEAGRMFLLQGKAKLVIMDSSADAAGTVIGNSVNDNGMLIMTNAADASVEIQGGNFYVRNPDLKTNNGGLLYAGTGSIKIAGGEFWGTSAANGGVVAVNNGNLEISGGILHAGSADAGDTVFAAGASNLTIKGSAIMKGGVYVDDITAFTLEGMPEIRKVAGGSAYSLKTKTPVTLGTLEEGAKIAVTSAPDQTVFTGELADEAAAKAAQTFFSSDDNNKIVKAEGKTLACVACEDAPADSGDKAQLNALYAGTTAYHGEMHDHSNSGGKSDGNATLDVWKAQMAELSMDFATIVDHKQASHMRHNLWDNTVFIGGTEPQTKLTTMEDGMGTMHFNMIFSQPEKLETVVYQFYDYDGVDFAYKDFSRSEMEALVQAVKDNCGVFVHVHPRGSKYIKSDDPLDYWFGNDTGLEVFYSLNGYNMNSPINRKHYKLWTDLLALGKRVWATAGRDQHTVPDVNSLTTIYSEQKHADSFVEHMRVGDFTAGAVGVRMSIGEVKGGSQTVFMEDHRLVLAIGDFHESLDATHVYRMDLFDDQGRIYSQEISATEENWFAFDVDPTVKFYRAEVYDVTDQIQIAFGQPIWNSTYQEDKAVWKECEHCGKTVEWSVWDGTNVPAAGHYYLESDIVEVSAQKSLTASGDVVIDLNGKTLKKVTEKNRMFRVDDSAKLVFLDSSLEKTGTVIGYQGSGGHAGIAQLRGGSLDIYGGTFTMAEGSAAYKGGLIYAYKNTAVPTINIYGGTFYGNQAKNGGVISVSNVMLNISGGTFYAGSILETDGIGGDTIYVDSASTVVTISGNPVIYGGIEVNAVKTFTVSGKPVIQKAEGGSAYSLKLASGKLLTVGELEDGASIGITAVDGVFTAELADENTALAATAFFVADDAAKAIVADGKALAIADKPETQRGDMNSDGEVTDADALYLLRHTLFADRYPIDQSGDVNGDGETSDADALYLLRYTLFPDRYPLN